MKNSTLKAKALHGAAWYGITRVVIQAISWVMTIAVARALQPTDYGLLGMACVYTGLVDFLNEQGLSVAVIQKKDISADDLDSVFWFSMVCSAALYGLTFLVAPVVAGFYAQPGLTSVLRVLGLMFIISNLRLIPWNLLTRAVEFKKRSIAEVAGNFVGGLTTLIMAYRNYGVWALVAGLLTREALITGQVWTTSAWRPRLLFHWDNLKQVMPLSLNAAGTRGVWYFYEVSDRLIIGKFLGNLALGYYTIAQRLTTDLIGRVVSIVNMVGFPVYARLQNDQSRLNKYFLTSIQLACLVVFPSMVGLSLVSPDLIPLLLKPKWTPMVPALQVMCWAAPIAMIYHLSNPVVLAKGEAGLMLRFNLLALAVMPAGFLIATRFGLRGVCLVWLLVFPLLMLVWFVRIKPLIGFEWRELWTAIKPGAISTMLMVAVLLAAQLANVGRLHPAARVAVLVTGGAIAYAGCLWVCFRQPLREIVTVMRARPIAPSAVPTNA